MARKQGGQQAVVSIQRRTGKSQELVGQWRREEIAKKAVLRLGTQMSNTQGRSKPVRQTMMKVMKCRSFSARRSRPESTSCTCLLIFTTAPQGGKKGVQTWQQKRQDLPFKEHSEGVFPETRLLLKDLLLENQPFTVPAILLQSFADEVQTCWQGKKQV